MEFIRNILFICEKSEFLEKLSDGVSKASKKLNVLSISDKGQLSEVLANQKLNAVFIKLPEQSDCLYIFRLLGMHKMKANPDMKIFFTSENFETFHEIVNNMVLDGVEVFPWPQKPDELAAKIADSVFDKQLSKEVVTKSNGKVTIDLEFIQVFVNATKKVLEEMGDVKDLTHHKPTYMDKMEKPLETGIASKIMISSEFFKGNFYVIFPEPTFLKLYANAVFEEHESINDENADFAGELANIIYGQSKKVLAASGLNLDMAIPSIHRSTQIQSELVIVIPFDSSIGNLYIAVAPGDL